MDEKNYWQLAIDKALLLSALSLIGAFLASSPLPVAGSQHSAFID